MTSPASDDKMSALVKELVERAEWLLQHEGKRDGHGLAYWRGNGVLIMKDTSWVLSIHLSELSIGMVYRGSAGWRAGVGKPEVQNFLVPQALLKLRQVMVLDDLSKV